MPNRILILALVLLSISLTVQRAYAKRPDPALYYIRSNAVYRLSLRKLKPKQLFKIPDNAIPTVSNDTGHARDVYGIKLGGGSLAWLAGNHLVCWTGKKIVEVSLNKIQSGDGGFELKYNRMNYEVARIDLLYRDLYVNRYLVSPDGLSIAWDLNVTTAATVDNDGTAKMQYSVFVSKLDDKNQRTVVTENFSVSGILADRGEKRTLVQWSKAKPHLIYANIVHIAQVTSEVRGLDSIDLINGKRIPIDETIEIPLAFSSDETKIAYTPNDESCCGGINYTNNAVYVRDLSNRTTAKIYDEWKEFNLRAQEGPDEESKDYPPVNASFSPNNEQIAISILGSDLREIVTVRDVRDGGNRIDLDQRQAIAWIGECELLLFGTGKWFVYNTSSHSEKSLPIDVAKSEIIGVSE